MPETRRSRRGIYLLPTLFTVGNLFCGFAALLQLLEGQIERAALLIVVAGILDGLDGRIARLTDTTSEFGVQFDSLADLVSFGVAPAILGFVWTLHSFERLGVWIAFLFVIAAAMRLARFNLRPAGEGRRFFAGLPSPPAAGTLAAVAFAYPAVEVSSVAAVARAMLVVSLALLMVSRFRYRSFKEIDLRNPRSFAYVLPIGAAVVAVIVYPKAALPLLAVAYVASAPVAYLARLAVRRPRNGTADSEVLDEPASR